MALAPPEKTSSDSTAIGVLMVTLDWVVLVRELVRQWPALARILPALAAGRTRWKPAGVGIEVGGFQGGHRRRGPEASGYWTAWQTGNVGSTNPPGLS
jgi:hypothetical protein